MTRQQHHRYPSHPHVPPPTSSRIIYIPRPRKIIPFDALIVMNPVLYAGMLTALVKKSVGPRIEHVLMDFIWIASLRGLEVMMVVQCVVPNILRLESSIKQICNTSHSFIYFHVVYICFKAQG